MAAKSQVPERRSYNQYCSIARSLDIIGERWTLLVIRDLLIGPQRYKDLLDRLPGIGTNLLADRLHQLEAAGLVTRRTLPPPAGSTVYDLTDDGRALEPVVAAIAVWGLRRIGRPRPGEIHSTGSYFMALRGTFRSELASKMNESLEFHIDGRIFTVDVRFGKCTTRQGPAEHPSAVITLDNETLNALMFERIAPKTALSSGSVKLDGDRQALERFVRLFSFANKGSGRIQTG